MRNKWGHGQGQAHSKKAKKGKHSMNISEKLDILMNITSTKNIALGKALSFDPSYISRIRSGSRGIPKNVPFTKPLASFFAGHIKADYQLETLGTIILGVGRLPDNPKDIEDILYKWLENDDIKTGNAEPVRDLLSDITTLFNTKSAPADIPIAPDSAEDISHDTSQTVPASVYYGNQGKRDSVIKFLSSLLSAKKPFQLCLFSDEDMTWLSEKPEFAREWALLLMQLMKSGSKIQIIHTISRDLNEIMEAIRKWIPLYSTGAIEPYYCPRLKDGIYRRSLFVARGHSALVSTSVETGTDNMANLLFRNSQIVASFEKEYDNYFALCRPLMKMYTKQNRKSFLAALTDNPTLGGQYFLSHPGPSVWSLPPELAEKIAVRSGYADAALYLKKMHAHMLDILNNGGKITEILYIPDKNKPLPQTNILLSEMIFGSMVTYVEDEYFSHLKYLCELTEKHENYKVLITNVTPQGMALLSHSDADTVIANSSSPSAAFIISHQQFSYAFYEYLNRFVKELQKKSHPTLKQYLSDVI